MTQLINDTKVPVVIDGQTIYVSASEAQKLKQKLSKNSIAVENPSPPIQWQGKSLICG
jgi:DNA-dependent RNA polymerase auxiliary subunit epsilon